MATSSSDESSTAPKDFHISSSIDSGSRSSLSQGRRCLLCYKLDSHFYCKLCVLSGSFYHSKLQATESFHDKQTTLLELEDKKRKLEEECLKLTETKRKADVLRAKIRQSRERNRILKLAVEEKKEKTTKLRENVNKQREETRLGKERLKFFGKKIAARETFLDEKFEGIEKLRPEIEQMRLKIQDLIKVRISQLKYIFPITKVKSKIEVGCADSEMVSALAEASQTNYIRDKWEFTDYFDEWKYSIVEPLLPSSGSYSAYNVWVKENIFFDEEDEKKRSKTTNITEPNAATHISDALTYTAQLVHLLAFFFNVRLPYRLVTSDFSGKYMREAQFNRRVARLNSNVLYLCYTQNIDVSNLKPRETIRNIVKLMDTNNPYMGCQGPYKMDGRKFEVLESSMGDDYSGDNTDSDEGDSFHREWETVPHIPCQEVPQMGPTLIQSSQSINTQQATTSMAVAGGLVTSAAASIASMWRGFTGR